MLALMSVPMPPQPLSYTFDLIVLAAAQGESIPDAKKDVEKRLASILHRSGHIQSFSIDDCDVDEKDPGDTLYPAMFTIAATVQGLDEDSAREEVERFFDGMDLNDGKGPFTSVGQEAELLNVEDNLKLHMASVTTHFPVYGTDSDDAIRRAIAELTFRDPNIAAGAGIEDVEATEMAGNTADSPAPTA